MTTQSLISIIKSELKKQEDPARAKNMKAYMKNLFEFYGVSSPIRKKIVAQIWKTHKPEIQSGIMDLVNELWKGSQRELQYTAMDLMAKCEKLLSVNDLPEIENLITHKSWWDTVDFLAANPLGSVLKDNSRLQHQKSGEYIDSGNMWLQRTSLLFQLKYKNDVDEKLLYKNISSLLGSKEFFINKAIGWALRQYSKYNPRSVRQFIEENRSKMAGLSIREGGKYV